MCIKICLYEGKIISITVIERKISNSSLATPLATLIVPSEVGQFHLDFNPMGTKSTYVWKKRKKNIYLEVTFQQKNGWKISCSVFFLSQFSLGSKKISSTKTLFKLDFWSESCFFFMKWNKVGQLFGVVFKKQKWLKLKTTAKSEAMFAYGNLSFLCDKPADVCDSKPLLKQKRWV